MLRLLHIRHLSAGSKNVPTVGTLFGLSRTFRDDDLSKFVALTGDNNPIHATNKEKKIDLLNGAHHGTFVNGAFLNAVIAGIIGTNFPGFVVTAQNFCFPNRCELNKEVHFMVRVEELRKVVTVSYECKQNNRIVFEGTAKLFSVRK